MKERLKIFTANNTKKLERAVNTWLAKQNEEVEKIISRHFASDEQGWSVAIFYYQRGE